MLRLRTIIGAGCMLAVGLLYAHAQGEDQKAILRKAIEAHGGYANVAKFRAVNTKFKGTMQIAGIMADINGETWLQKPDKVKNVLKLDIGGKSIDVITVLNGPKLWVSSMGKAMEVTDEKILNAARAEMQAEGAGNLVDYLKAPYELSAVGEVKVKGKAAIGVRISNKGQKDMSVFFDKQTSLVVKTEMRTLDAATGQEVTQEKFVIGYQEQQGLKVPKRVEIVKDGKTFMDIEISGVTLHERIDDATFAKP